MSQEKTIDKYHACANEILALKAFTATASMDIVRERRVVNLLPAMLKCGLIDRLPDDTYIAKQQKIRRHVATRLHREVALFVAVRKTKKSKSEQALITGKEDLVIPVKNELLKDLTHEAERMGKSVEEYCAVVLERHCLFAKEIPLRKLSLFWGLIKTQY